MFREETYEVIRKRILENINNGIDKREGSVTSNIISPLAEELAKSYMAIGDVLAIGFIESAITTHLDKRVNEFGLYRKTGEKAIGEIEVTGNGTFKIPSGTVVISDGLEFITTSEFIYPQTNLLPVRASEVGYKYNILKSSEFTFKGRFDGDYNVLSLIANNDFINGVDKETDEELKERFKLFIKNPRTSGNIHHYEQWALECEGVGKAKVFPLWDGNGTVKVMITGNDNRPVDMDLIENCKNHIETLRPIGATVTITTPTILGIDINLNFKLNKEYSLTSAENKIKEVINEYINNINDEVVYSKIYGIIANLSEVNDIVELKINKEVDNISIEVDKIAVVNSVNIVGVIDNE